MSSAPQDERPHIWAFENALSHYQGTDSSDADHTRVHLTGFQFEPVPLNQQFLPGPPLAHDGESTTQIQGFTTQGYPNDVLAYSGADHTRVHGDLAEFQFETMPFTLPVDQQRLPGPPYNGGGPALPQFFFGGSDMLPYNTSQLLPPELALPQSTGGGLEQSPGTPQLTGARHAQEAEPHRHSSVAVGEQARYSCNWPNCVTVTNFKRPQELARHIREVHGSDSPCKCPFCPPADRRTWKRPYLLKNHLIGDHCKEFGEDDIERIRFLKGKDVFGFVDTIRSPQS